MRNIRVARASLLALLLLPIRAYAAPLTLDDALKIFRTRGFDLLIADAAIESARADLTTAGALPNPSLSLSRGRSHTYDPTQCDGCSATAIGVGVTDSGALSDVVSRRRALRQRVAELALSVAQSSRADVERTLEFNVKQQMLSAQLARRSLDYAREAESLASQTLNLVNIRYRAGAVSGADVARASTQKLEADQAVDLAQQNFESARFALAYLLGYGDSPQDFEVADDLLRRADPPALASASREALLAGARAHRPDLTAASMQVARARASIDLANRLVIPDFTPSLQYSAEGSGQNAIQPPTWTLGVNVTLPLLDRHRGEVARARADLQSQEVARIRVDAQVAADVGTAWAAFVSARSRVTRMESELLAAAEQARDLVKLQYEKGSASLFEFLDAQRTFPTQNESLSALNDYWTAVFQLEQATATEFQR